MEIGVSITNGTAFSTDLGEEEILQVAFTTANPITYEAASSLYFYAVITEAALSQTVCFELDGAANPLPAGTQTFAILNTEGFTDAAAGTGAVYYTAAA